MNSNSLFNPESFNKFADVIFWIGKFKVLPEIDYIFGNCEAFFGYKPETLLKKNGQILSIIHADDIQEYKHNLHECASDPTREAFSAEFRINTAHEKVVWVKEKISFERNEAGEITSAAGFIVDINEYKSNEASLSDKNEFLIQLNASKDRFISILSHDLRAPFTSILGFSEILLTDTGISESERNEYLNYIHESSNNQLQLINYLLDWSRLQTGRIKVDLKRLHARTIVYNCISSLTGNAIRKNIEIKASIPEQLYINVDERLISQVIINLLSNAIKFSPENKRIDIIADTFNDESIEFIIKDQGIGIPEENKEKIFKVDKMFTTEGTKGEKGTGLGLSLVKEIVEKHKGEIWFYSRRDSGSEFHFTVPMSKSKILVIETDPEISSMINDVVSGNFPDFEIVVKKNGYDAMSLMYSAQPGLIILNHNIPFMDGAQFIKFVRENVKGVKIPVIVLVNELNDEIRDLYLEYNIHSYLLMPLDMYHLNKELNVILESEF